MHREQEDVLLGPKAIQRGAHHQVGSEVERPPRLTAEPVVQLALAVAGRNLLEVDDGQWERPLVERDLARLAALCDIHRAKALVPLDHAGERPRERFDVELADETRGADAVLRRSARLQLVEEPHPMLGEGERSRLVGAAGRDRRGRGAAAQGFAKKRTLVGGQRLHSASELRRMRGMDTQRPRHPPRGTAAIRFQPTFRC